MNNFNEHIEQSVEIPERDQNLDPVSESNPFLDSLFQDDYQDLEMAKKDEPIEAELPNDFPVDPDETLQGLFSDDYDDKRSDVPVEAKFEDIPKPYDMPKKSSDISLDTLGGLSETGYILKSGESVTPEEWTGEDFPGGFKPTYTADSPRSQVITDNGEHTLTEDVSEVKSPIQNKLDGLAREKEVAQELREQYPPEEGYRIIPEAYLRDKDGNIVRDPVTGEARRIDFVVEKDGKIVDSVEVTSKTADKTDQMAKENRIRENGGNYVRNSDGELVKIPSDVHTRIERRD